MASLFEDDEQIDAAIADLERDLPAAAESDGPPPPPLNSDLLGHEAIERAFLEDIKSNRLPHALVLSGPLGIGKATLAYRLARYLFSQEGGDSGLFGDDMAPPENLYVATDHPVFRRVASGGHADLLLIEREYDEKKGRLKNDISVESVRRIHPFIRKTAAEGGWRVVIVDGAEYLNASGQNALLKCLEEPPSRTLFVLTTSLPGALLPTIRSRCRLVRMEPLGEDKMARLLLKYAPAATQDEQSILIRLAQGSIGKALRYYKDGGAKIYHDFVKLLKTLPNLDIVFLHDLSERVGRNGAEQSYEVFRDIVSTWCEQTVLQRWRNNMTASEIPDSYTAQHFFRAWEKIDMHFQQTESRNLDKRQAVLHALLMLQKPDFQGLNT